MKQLQKAIISTLVYGDIFDYPLNSEELYKFLISNKPLNFSEFKKALTLIYANKKRINSNNGYYFLSGRDETVKLRKKREGWSKKKIKIAENAAWWLKLIPWVKMVGVTGSLALLNSDNDDDIDILIVSARNRLWLTRLLTTTFVELTGMRRHPLEYKECKEKIRNKICLNMFLDEDHLVVPKKEQDLFTAHEACQMRMLWDKDDTYQKFLYKNSWVKEFLPNGIDTKILRYYDTKRKRNKRFSVLNIIENLARNFQLWYMKKRRTTETITEGIIRFHPQDARAWILKEYNLKLKNLRWQ